MHTTQSIFIEGCFENGLDVLPSRKVKFTNDGNNSKFEYYICKLANSHGDKFNLSFSESGRFEVGKKFGSNNVKGREFFDEE